MGMDELTLARGWLPLVSFLNEKKRKEGEEEDENKDENKRNKR